jgi:hypothetical protein
MAKPWSEQQIQRWTRELAGHAKDKDRARRKRRLAGKTLAAPARPRAHDLPDRDALEEGIELPDETGGDGPDATSD